MSIEVKYRVRELAKDFAINGKPVGNKQVTEILTKYAKAPTSPMTSLSSQELSLVFESLSQTYQVENLDDMKAPVQAVKKTVVENKNEDKNKNNTESKPVKNTADKPRQNNKRNNDNSTANGTAQGTTAKNNNRTNNRNNRNNNGERANDRNSNNNNNNNGERTNDRNNNNNRQQYKNNAKSDAVNNRSDNRKFDNKPDNKADNRVDNRDNRVKKTYNKSDNVQPAKKVEAPVVQSDNKAPVVEKQPVSKVPQKKIVNTRNNVDVNLDRYDDHLEELAGEHADRMDQGKQKINSKRQQQQKTSKQSNKRRLKELEEQQKRMHRQQEMARKAPVKVQIPDEITVGELASRMKKTGAEVVTKLMQNGIMAGMSETIDFDTAALIAEDFGCKVEHEVIVTIEEKLIDTAEDKEEDLETRPPVIVVMGHVDHGKTSLLDYIRSSKVAAGEAGGITQAIGAYQVKVQDKLVTFLDTPGHEAFTAMRARGAMVTDIAILVIAGNDGIMPQTVEAINHAKAAKIPIVVAVNKMDLPGANAEKVKEELTKYDLLSEDWGGDTIVVPISAKTGEGIDELLDNVLIVAEMAELRANPNRAAKGAVIEAKLDKGRGPVATLLVQNGTLKQGDVIIAGTAVGRVRAMTDYRGRRLKTAGPSVPVEITGMAEVPGAGDDFYAVADERMARELAEQRKAEKKLAANAPNTKVSLEDLFSQMQQGELKELNIIVKADVQGSVEAVKQNLEKLSNDEVRVRVIHGGVGAINESDVMLAATSNAIIVGFNVRPDLQAKNMAERDKVDMRMYRVIYECIEEIEAAMKGMLAPTYKEEELGRVEVRQVYKISNVGIVAGSYVQEGKVTRNAKIRLVRDGIVIHEGEIASLQRFKDSVKEVTFGYECGITLEKFTDIKVGDIFECFHVVEVAR